MASPQRIAAMKAEIASLKTERDTLNRALKRESVFSAAESRRADAAEAKVEGLIRGEVTIDGLRAMGGQVATDRAQRQPRSARIPVVMTRAPAFVDLSADAKLMILWMHLHVFTSAAVEGRPVNFRLSVRRVGQILGRGNRVAMRVIAELSDRRWIAPAGPRSEFQFAQFDGTGQRIPFTETAAVQHGGVAPRQGGAEW